MSATAPTPLKKRTPYGTGPDARRAAKARAEVNPAAILLLQECTSSPNGQLMKTVNLLKLKDLVVQRTQIPCPRDQYRSQPGLVEYLMEYFPTSQQLLDAVQWAIYSDALPPDFNDFTDIFFDDL